MNNKGFGLKEFIIVIAVVFICLIIIMGLYKQITKDDEENVKEETISEEVSDNDGLTYHDLELILKSAASRYQDATYQTTDDAVVSMVLTSDFLEKKDYLDSIKDLKTKKPCEGYVLFHQDHARITYKAYLKCDGYKTKGFNKKYLD